MSIDEDVLRRTRILVLGPPPRHAGGSVCSPRARFGNFAEPPLFLLPVREKKVCYGLIVPYEREAYFMFDRLTCAPHDDEEMEDFHDYEDEEQTDLTSKLDDFDDDDDEDDDEEELAAIPVTVPATPPSGRKLPSPRPKLPKSKLRRLPPRNP